MDKSIPKPILFVLALAQGSVLSLLYRNVDQAGWLATEPSWLTALASFFIIFPTLVYFVLTKTNVRASLTYLLPFSLLMALIGAYVGSQLEPVEWVRNAEAVATLIFTSIIACFKYLMVSQVLLQHKTITYPRLFHSSWRTFLLFALSCTFVGIFWLVLHLGGELFHLIGIDFFNQLLQKDWFAFPAVTLAFGFAVCLFRANLTNVEHISTLLKTLFTFLLPALSVISIAFLFTLPFYGLNALWNTGSGSFLLLWLQALTLFFVNAVYQQDSQQGPYHLYLHRLIFIAVAILTIYSLIAAYGIWLRVDQYGLTLDRCWAITIWFLLCCFSIGYLMSIMTNKDEWLSGLAKVNLGMGGLVFVVMLMVNTPILNFQALTVQSQLARLNAAPDEYDTFDFQYFEYDLGRQGYLALQALKAQWQDSHPERVAIIDRLYAHRPLQSKKAKSFDEFYSLITFWPEQTVFPNELLKDLYHEESKNEWSSYHGNHYYLIAVDLNQDGQAEFISITENNYETDAMLWQPVASKEVDAHGYQASWQGLHMITSNPSEVRFLKALLSEHKIKVNPPKWQDLQIGDLTFKVNLEKNNPFYK